MRGAPGSFALVMTIGIMILAALAAPGWARLVLILPAALGALWAIARLRRRDAGKSEAE
jgi:hypothetical protein